MQAVRIEKLYVTANGEVTPPVIATRPVSKRRSPTTWTKTRMSRREVRLRAAWYPTVRTMMKRTSPIRGRTDTDGVAES